MDYKEYWKDHWNNREKITQPQLAQVERTFEGKPVNRDIWGNMVQYAQGQLELFESSVILDLCAGNGLFSEPMAEVAKEVVAVDFSANLLKEIKNDKIRIIESDICELKIEKDYFTHVLLYAGIQYLNEKEALMVFENVYNGMKEQGLFFIADIPDRSFLWHFANTKEYKIKYFENLKNNTPAIGSWFLKQDLEEMAKYVGFKKVEILEQPSWSPYSHFKFDMKLSK